MTFFIDAISNSSAANTVTEIFRPIRVTKPNSCKVLSKDVLRVMNFNLDQSVKLSALHLLMIGEEKNIYPKVVEAMEDGGIFIDFFNSARYIAIEFYKDGEISALRRKTNQKEIISTVTSGDLDTLLD